MPSAARRPGPGVVPAVILIAIGVMVGVVTAVKMVPPFLEGLVGPVRAIPLDARFKLSSGTYGVYERTGTKRGGDGLTVTEHDAPRIAPGNVSGGD